MEFLERRLKTLLKELLDGKLAQKYLLLEKKIEKNDYTKEEYKEYKKIKNIMENIEQIKNITNYIIELEGMIEKEKNKNEERKKERQMQAEEYKLKLLIEKLEKDCDCFRKILENEEIEGDNKDYIKEQLDNSLIELDKSKKRYLEIKKMNEEIAQKRKHIKGKVETPEESKEKILKINDKIHQFSIVLESLLEGTSWDDAISDLMQWQRNRYRFDKKNDKYFIKNDMELMKEDMRVAYEIIDIAMGEKINTRDIDDGR